jgi:hypothetical protein
MSENRGSVKARFPQRAVQKATSAGLCERLSPGYPLECLDDRPPCTEPRLPQERIDREWEPERL